MNRVSQRLRSRFLIVLGISVLFLAGGLYTELGNIENVLASKRLNWVTRVVEQKSQLLNVHLNKIAQELKNREGKNFDYFLTFEKESNFLQRKGLSVLVFYGDSLRYWSDNSVSFTEGSVVSRHENGLVHLPTGWYVEFNRYEGPYVISGFIQICQEYSYENKYLTRHFQSDLHLPDNYGVFPAKTSYSRPVYSYGGQYLFSIQVNDNQVNRLTDYYLPAVLYGIALFFFIFSLFLLSRMLSTVSFFTRMGGLAVIIGGVYLLIVCGQWPHAIRELNLFSPAQFACSNLLPSLGAMLLLALLFFVWALFFYREGKRLHVSQKCRKRNYALSQLFNLIVLWGCVYLLEVLFANSSVSFELQNVIQLSIYSYISYGVILLLLAASFLISLRISSVYQQKIKGYYALIVLGVLVLIAYALASVTGITTPGLFAGYFGILNMVMFSMVKERFSRYRLTYLVAFSLIASLFLLFYSPQCLIKRDREVQKTLAENLATERDPTAEVLLSEIDEKIKTDGILRDMLAANDYNVQNYLQQTYFYGYFRKYDMQFPICSEGDSIFVDQNVYHSCYPYFENLIRTKGVRLPGTNFYLLERMNGRICYFGRFFFKDILPKGRTLYVELHSKVLSEGIGFPELLLDEKVLQFNNQDRFSSAKFYDGKLVDRKGVFQYNLSAKEYLSKVKKSGFFELDNYIHYLYRLEGSNLIIVSRPQIVTKDYLASFPYVFVMFFVFGVVLLLLNRGRRKTSPGLKQKIQIAFVSVMLVSMILMAIGIVVYNVKDYQTRHKEDLDDKLQSVLSELSTQVTELDTLDGYLQVLRESELFRLSDIFSTDINLYDLDGNLLASSRPEIFKKGLLSERMNPIAFTQLAEKDQLKYMQPEKIGNMEYLSAYIPLINGRGKELAYINLPYFVREDRMKQEVTTFIVAFINIYVFMILASVLIAVAISGQVTRPLELLREKLRAIQLGKRNEEISYKGDDEIGSIVKEYNRKVVELAASADRLAQSEREMAWREMARQIAHEIKNPLTPMKLNIQYLQRAKKEQLPDYDAFFERATKILIEQIDVLSDIASSFSNFAKMSKSNLKVLSLKDRIREVCDLFLNTENVGIAFKDDVRDVMILADQVQLTRVLVNLVKNAIQAIPKERKGIINIEIIEKKDWCIVKIMDNGTGISEELQDKLFQPNFTTKTGGMGLGLAISKRIIEDFKGRIWFETEVEKGSCFYVELPIVTGSEEK